MDPRRRAPDRPMGEPAIIGQGEPAFEYTPAESFDVGGRQGVRTRAGRPALSKGTPTPNSDLAAARL